LFVELYSYAGASGVTMQLLLWYSCSGVSFSLIVYTEPPISFLVLVSVFDHCSVEKHTASPSQKGVVDPAI